MSIATLVVGLGGTGVMTLRALKKLYYGDPEGPSRGLPEEERVPLSLLAFDFDRSALMAGDQKFRFADLAKEEFFYLNPTSLQETLRNLDRGTNGGLAWEKVLRWFPDREHVQIPVSEVEANGASQLRVLGRLGFFLNDEVIERAVRSKLNLLGSEVNPSRLAQDKRVVIVSSIAGGTGAGMLVDMAYVARRQLLRPRVFAYVLLPEVFQDVDSGGRIFQNTYACLKELAYLKDQQIPFDAEYERIAPINVPVKGEEPFSRIFLCRGEGFAGAEAIKEATVQIAQSILGQLQRTIQEKTLAIASNTLSADTDEEQRKRRTHCFSAVTSSIIDLKPIDVPHLVLETVSQVLRDPQKLEMLYKSKVEGAFEKTGRQFEVSEEEESSPGEEKPKEEEGKAFSPARRLAQAWEQRIQEAVKSTGPALEEQIHKVIAQAERDIKENPEELSQPRRNLAEVKKLLPGTLRASSAADVKIEYLKELQTILESFDQQVHKLVLTMAPEREATIQDAIGRAPQYSNLLRWVWFRDAPDTTLPTSISEKEKALSERPKEDWEGIRGLRTSKTDDFAKLLLDCHDMMGIFPEEPADQAKDKAAVKAIKEATLEELKSFLRSRASGLIRNHIEEYRQKVEKRYEVGKEMLTEMKPQTGDIQGRFNQLGHLRPKVEEWIRDHLPELLGEAKDAVDKVDLPDQRREKLFDLIKRRLKQVPELKGPHYYLDVGKDDVEDFVRDRLVRSRQQIFERRTPNPQRKGMALIMVPQGLIWTSGDRQALRRFLEASASQILASRVQLEDYEGSRIWLYYEDLFNPPEHVRNIDEYFRTYATQKFKELFHIDRRFLENPTFKEVHSQRATITVVCGNDNCRENISHHPREDHICPGCGKMIRSRCGNKDCTDDALNRKPEEERTRKNCPTCNGFNHAAWWCCNKHGKIPYEVPIDKERCPWCIQEYQRDPMMNPFDGISVRPDVREALKCPHCVEEQKRDAKWEPFIIPRKLKQFYENGVNGHDRDTFMKLAADHHLPQKVRCPKCRTLLIPVHHKNMSPPTCGGGDAQ